MKRKTELNLILMNLIMKRAYKDISIGQAKELLDFLDLDDTTTQKLRNLMKEDLDKKAREIDFENDWNLMQLLDPNWEEGQE